MTKLFEFVRRMSDEARRQLPAPPTGERWRIAPPGDMPLAADLNTVSVTYELVDEPIDHGAASVAIKQELSYMLQLEKNGARHPMADLAGRTLEYIDWLEARVGSTDAKE